MKRTREGGFTYLGVLFLVGLMTLTAGMASAVWSTAQHRENERQLIFAGRQLQTAIERYAQSARAGDPQGAGARYPHRLEDLLRDPRALEMRRHLRQLYTDPMTGEREWGLIRLGDGAIVGVHSLSTRRPLGGPPDAVTSRAGEGRYRDWQFIAPSAQALLAASAPAAAQSTAPQSPAASVVPAR